MCGATSRLHRQILLGQKIEKAPSGDEAFSLIMGGYVYGISMFGIMAVVFYASLKVFVF